MRHVLRVANRVSELRPLSAWAVETAQALGCPDDRCGDVDLSLTEAVANVICHGYTDDSPHEIGVEIAREPDALVVRIEDDARPFDPLAMPMSTSTSLDEAAPSGRGIVLMRGAADAVSYERREGLNRLTLRFAIRD